MKTILYALLFCTTANAQFGLRTQYKEQFLISTHVDVLASIKEDGINQAFEAEYSGGLIYTKLGFEYFTGLPVTTYFDWHGGLGINLVSGYNETFRYYAGARIGRIYRGSYGANPFHGFEAGITVKLNESLRLGVRGTYDYRRDQLLFNDPVFYRESGFITITWVVKDL